MQFLVNEHERNRVIVCVESTNVSFMFKALLGGGKSTQPHLKAAYIFFNTRRSHEDWESPAQLLQQYSILI